MVGTTTIDQVLQDREVAVNRAPIPATPATTPATVPDPFPMIQRVAPEAKQAALDIHPLEAQVHHPDYFEIGSMVPSWIVAQDGEILEYAMGTIHAAAS